ncbi:MAG: DUF1905 domain-containing protein [Candidatus Kapabacteria bacterium]|nr:DUF1905 domain-containing protein [Candidatus Kapabacteria bacterium]
MTTYTCSGDVWKYDGPTPWYVVSLPVDVSANIRAMFSVAETGWGRLHVRAAIDNVAWDTAIWYDTKRATYLLPLKAAVRTKCGIDVGHLSSAEHMGSPHRTQTRRSLMIAHSRASASDETTCRDRPAG